MIASCEHKSIYYVDWVDAGATRPYEPDQVHWRYLCRDCGGFAFEGDGCTTLVALKNLYARYNVEIKAPDPKQAIEPSEVDLRNEIKKGT